MATKQKVKKVKTVKTMKKPKKTQKKTAKTMPNVSTKTDVVCGNGADCCGPKECCDPTDCSSSEQKPQQQPGLLKRIWNKVSGQ